MKKTILLSILATIALVIVLQSCNKSDLELSYREDSLKLPAEVMNYETLNLPSGFFLQKTPNFTNHGATLGRVLFYDRKLSVNNKIACASCHHQELAFSDGVAISDGFSDKKTRRNAMNIINTLNESTFFWDSRSNDLTDMVLMPVRDHIEMGLEELGDLETKLAATSYYSGLFNNAFGSSEITKEKIADALTQFLNSMVTANSKFDQAAASNFSSFNADEKAGLDLFWGKATCGSCHGGTDFRGSWGEDWANIGLDLVYDDNGLGEISGAASNGMFKVPSLRNIEMTAPYMHDGRFKNLEEVVEHYNSNIQKHDNLDWRVQDFSGNGDPVRLGLTATEKRQLITFLKTLTDQQFINDPKFSDPFQR
jgi:cytochrome c peroxidase